MIEVIQIFNNYAKQYDFNNYDIRLKYNHSIEVFKLSEEIAKSLSLSNHDIYLAKLIGLFHDIGRFDQIKNYNTYNDIISFDHGDYGVEVIVNNKLIDNIFLDAKDKKIIIDSIINHNKLRIDEKLDERTNLFCKILRDADKLSIINLCNKGTIVMEKDNELISDKVLNSFFKNEEIKEEDINSKLDINLVKVGFTFDINFKYTLNQIVSNKMIEKLLDKLIVDNSHEQEKLFLIKEKVIKYLKSRMEENKC